MRFTIAAAALVSVATATYDYAPPAYNSSAPAPVETPAYTPAVPVYVTKTTSEYTTICPGPTEVVQGTKTYTVTEATTLTITDCPCTYVEEETPAPEAPYTPVAPSSEAPPVVPYPTSNGTAPAPPVYVPTGTGAPAPSKSAPSEFEGAAAQYGVSGALLAIGALAAFL